MNKIKIYYFKKHGSGNAFILIDEILKPQKWNKEKKKLEMNVKKDNDVFSLVFS